MKSNLDNFRVIIDRKKFKKVVDLNDPAPKGLPNGMLENSKLKEIEPGSCFTFGEKTYYVFPCTLEDYLMGYLKRRTQIIYPKEAGYILLHLDISPGRRVGEAGTGSGAMTAIFSRALGTEGRIYSFERRQDFGEVIKKNLEGCKTFDNVEQKGELLDESELPGDLDAFFLDMKFPWEVMEKVKEVLKPGGNLGILVPTTNQVSRALEKLEELNFHITETSEILLRKFKINPERLRPEDVMTGHTGFLIFARKIIKDGGVENGQQD